MDRPRVVHFLEMIRDGNPANPDFQHRVIRDFVRAVYLYDDYFKLVVDFTGKNVTYKYPLSKVEKADNDTVTDCAQVCIEGNEPRQKVLIQTRGSTEEMCKGFSLFGHQGSIEVVGQTFVITWCFKS